MLNGCKLVTSSEIGRRTGLVLAAALVVAGSGSAGVAQQANASGKPHEVYVPIPGFDTTSIDTSVDPCNDFYKFACGKFGRTIRFRPTSPRWASFTLCTT
jgi:endothelin-converting enzyme/putative endopeptidase